MKTFLALLTLLAATAFATAAQFTIAWDCPTAAADGVTHYRVYTLGPSQTLIATIPADTTSTTISLPPSPNAYTIVVRASSPTGESSDSNQLVIRVHIPTAPTNLRRQ